MKRLAAVIGLILLAGLAWGETSNPQGLPSASGDSSNSSLSNFQVLGDNTAGIVSNNDYIIGSGLATMIFQPLTPTPGTYTPTIPAGKDAVVSYPNPFNPDSENCTIAYKYATDAQVQIYIFDVTGTIIKMIITNSGSSRASDGYSRYSWDGKIVTETKLPAESILSGLLRAAKVLVKPKSWRSANPLLFQDDVLSLWSCLLELNLLVTVYHPW
jgi:hypothetical protein